MAEEKAPKSLEDILPHGSEDFIHIPGTMLNYETLPEQMKGALVNTDIWRIDTLNAPTLDCTFQPNGYCLKKVGVFYVGPTMIACQPPFAYIRWTKKALAFNHVIESRRRRLLEPPQNKPFCRGLFLSVVAMNPD